jgi:two-component system, NtrC family, nitrogen regulation sensor histidine kinase NtrY
VNGSALPRRGSFERRLLIALVFFAVVPSLVLLAVGGYAVFQGIALTGSPAAWERVAESARDLLAHAERVPDPAMQQAADRHRAELSESLVQARRWEYLLQQAILPIAILLFLLAATIVFWAIRAARRLAHELAQPIHTLVGWAGSVAREEPLPAPTPGDPAERGEFGVLREAFRSMSAELAHSRERALEAERTRAWARLARGVAHELKNPLTPMRLAMRTLERRVDANDEPAREALEVLAAESARLEELARAFSQFGRLPEGSTSEVDLREMLDYLLRTHLPASVGYRLKASVGLPNVQGHHDALSRAFANLLLNAVDAMGEAGGAITVTLARIDEGVEARIADTGPGVPAENLDRIWEPDFTTKSSGTGLGLSLVRQAVQAHGGAVAARNRAAGGAEFVVRLPLDGRMLSRSAPRAPTGQNATGRFAASPSAARTSG